jgi:hypothetical protein
MILCINFERPEFQYDAASLRVYPQAGSRVIPKKLDLARLALLPDRPGHFSINAISKLC